MKRKDPDISDTTRDDIDRRTMLKSLAALALTPALLDCGADPGPGAEPAAQPGDVIDTIVVLMLENRSFDHYLGALSLQEGRSDIDGLVAGMSNPHPRGGTVEIYPEEIMCAGDPPHSWGASREQFNGGANDGFVKRFYDGGGADEAEMVMGYLTRPKLPVLYSFADQFTICDRWFSSVMGPTWPNRFYVHGAQCSGEKANNVAGDYSFETIYHRLHDKRIDYATYYSNVSFMMALSDVPGHGFMRGFEEFHRDAEAGELPSYVVLEPTYGRNCDHPPVNPMAGQLLMASVIDSLAKSPHWDRCMLFVVYDEHGGFFDHVPPPLTEDNYADEGFDQLGFRVPAAVVGPYVKEKFASHMVYDHSSILAFTERLWGLDSLTKRDAAANDLFDVLDMERVARRDPRPAPTIPVVTATEEELYGPPCSEGYKSGARSSITGQRELEQYSDTLYRGPIRDRRAQTDALYERFLRDTLQRGLWRPR